MVMTVGHGGREREYEYRTECLSVVAVKCTEDHCQFDVSCTVIPVTWQPMPLKNLGPKAHTLRTHVGEFCAQRVPIVDGVEVVLCAATR